MFTLSGDTHFMFSFGVCFVTNYPVICHGALSLALECQQAISFLQILLENNSHLRNFLKLTVVTTVYYAYRNLFKACFVFNET